MDLLEDFRYKLHTQMILAMSGSSQSGKTTLTARFLERQKINYFQQVTELKINYFQQVIILNKLLSVRISIKNNIFSERIYLNLYIIFSECLN
jgi:ABC-type phosphate transport system ATPase subunit